MMTDEAESTQVQVDHRIDELLVSINGFVQFLAGLGEYDLIQHVLPMGRMLQRMKKQTALDFLRVEANRQQEGIHIQDGFLDAYINNPRIGAGLVPAIGGGAIGAIAPNWFGGDQNNLMREVLLMTQKLQGDNANKDAAVVARTEAEEMATLREQLADEALSVDERGVITKRIQCLVARIEQRAIDELPAPHAPKNGLHLLPGEPHP